MALDGLNAAAAAAILNQAGVDQATKTRGVIVSAFVPGVLGLAVPFVLARNAKPSDPAGGNRVQVPDVSSEGLSESEATRELAARRLRVKKVVKVYGDDNTAGTVIGQQPAAEDIVALDLTVTLTVNVGAVPPEGRDLTRKLGRAEAVVIMERIDDMEANLKGYMEGRLKHEMAMALREEVINPYRARTSSDDKDDRGA